MSDYDIYGIGAALVDTEIEVTDLDLVDLGVEKGVMTLVDEKRQEHLINQLSEHLTSSKRASGGSAANSIIAASFFGSKNFYSCLVANDDNGKFYLSDLAEAGVDYHNMNGYAHGITGKCLVMITPDAERTMNTFLGVSEHLSEKDIDEDALARSKYAYIEGYLVTSQTGKPAAIALRKLAEKYGVKTAVSLSDPAIVKFFHSGLQDIIGEKVDLLFCNQAEALAFSQKETLEDAFEALKKHASTFVVTLGAKGAKLFDGSEEINIAGHKTEALDSNGAGDMFAGAFLYALTQEKSFREAGNFASLCAAKVVSQFGPRLAPAQHRELLDAVQWH